MDFYLASESDEGQKDNSQGEPSKEKVGSDVDSGSDSDVELVAILKYPTEEVAPVPVKSEPMTPRTKTASNRPKAVNGKLLLSAWLLSCGSNYTSGLVFENNTTNSVTAKESVPTAIVPPTGVGTSTSDTVPSAKKRLFEEPTPSSSSTSTQVTVSTGTGVQSAAKAVVCDVNKTVDISNATLPSPPSDDSEDGPEVKNYQRVMQPPIVPLKTSSPRSNVSTTSAKSTKSVSSGGTISSGDSNTGGKELRQIIKTNKKKLKRTAPTTPQAVAPPTPSKTYLPFNSDAENAGTSGSVDGASKSIGSTMPKRRKLESTQPKSKSPPKVEPKEEPKPQTQPSRPSTSSYRGFYQPTSSSGRRLDSCRDARAHPSVRFSARTGTLKLAGSGFNVLSSRADHPKPKEYKTSNRSMYHNE